MGKQVRKDHGKNVYVLAKSYARILDRTSKLEIDDVLDLNVSWASCICHIVDEDFCELLDMTLGIGTLSDWRTDSHRKHWCTV